MRDCCGGYLIEVGDVSGFDRDISRVKNEENERKKKKKNGIRETIATKSRFGNHA